MAIFATRRQRKDFRLELMCFLRDGSFETNEFQELLSEIKRRPS